MKSFIVSKSFLISLNLFILSVLVVAVGMALYGWGRITIYKFFLSYIFLFVFLCLKMGLDKIVLEKQIDKEVEIAFSLRTFCGLIFGILAVISIILHKVIDLSVWFTLGHLVLALFFADAQDDISGDYQPINDET